MTRISAIATAAAMTLVLGLPAGAAAQMPDTRDRTIMTFSAPVELPGMRLQAGTYVFRLADTASRNVVQVLSRDEMEMLGQWLFIPAERREVTGETVVTFRETSAGSTPAIQYWYYPGESIGKEFIYPKDQALRIARRTGATVQTEDGPVTADATASAAAEPAEDEVAVSGVVEGSGLPAESEPVSTQARRTPSTTSSDEAIATGTSGEAEQESAAAPGYAADELPSTGSPLAVMGLLAGLSLAGVAAFRRYRR